MKQELLKSAKQSLGTLKAAFPIMIGVLLIVGFLNTVLEGQYDRIFTGGFWDPLIGNIAGSISFGIPLTSYIIGGELLKSGVSLLAVTAFIMAWTTVGVAMLPLEAKFLGYRFAIARNAVNFVFALIIAVLTVYTVSLL